MLRLIQLSLFGLLAALIASPASARDGEWKLIGTQSLSYQQDQALSQIGRSAGRIGKLQIRAWGQSIFIRGMTIVFRNGEEQVLRVRELVEAGGASSQFTIKGQSRSIRQIRLAYGNRRPPGLRRTLVEIYAQQAAARDDRPPVDGRWSVSAAQTITTADSRIVLRLGRNAGRLSAIAIRALDQPVFMRDIVIRFGNGDVQRQRLDELVNDRDQTQSIDLNRGSRFIVSVTLNMVPQRRRRSARVQLLTRRADPRPAVLGVPSGWVRFGTKSVGFLVDRDVIRVGREKGRFDRIVLRVLDSDVLFRSVRVVYGNGQTQVLRLDEIVPANGRSRILQLNGDRFIRRIEMVYQSRPGFRGLATVEVFGEYAEGWIDERDGLFPLQPRPRPGKPVDWIALGSARAQMFGRDVDTIAVGRGKGRFRALKIRILKHDVKIYALRVIFENGAVSELPIRGRIKDGRFSRVVNLPLRRGRGRFIRVVQVEHQTKINFKGDGATQVWGQR